MNPKFFTNKLFCFSPTVMLATFAVEIALAVWVLWRYRQNTTTRLSVAILALLALFQFAEFNVCTTLLGLDSLTWSKIGYVAITFLPPLGIHALYSISGKIPKTYVASLYILAVAFAGYFLVATDGLTSSVCGGNYAIFEVNPDLNTFYMVYYYGLELLAVYTAWQLARTQTKKNVRNALYGLSFGYLCLLIPTTTVNIINPETIRGIPSIMCGFAVLLALVLALYVVPQVTKKRPS